MNNKWLKLALVSFIGIVVSAFSLYLIQAINGQSPLTGNITGNTQVNHSSSHNTSQLPNQNQTQVTPDHSQPQYPGAQQQPNFYQQPTAYQHPGPYWHPGPGIH